MYEKKHINYARAVILGIMIAVVSIVAVAKPIRASASNDNREQEAEEAIIDMVEAVNNKDWDSFTYMMCSSEQSYYISYFSDKSYTNGIKQVESVVLERMINVDKQIAEAELLTDSYPILAESEEVHVFVVELNCEVSKENQYFYNGINYFQIAVALEDGEMKIAQFNRPLAELLEQTVAAEIKESDSRYAAELAGINVIEHAECGLVINAEGEILTDGFITVGTQAESNDGISVCDALMPILGTYSSYSYPSTITVLLDIYGGNQVVTVDFDSYVKNVLSNEWFESWDSDSLQAGAYCIKMVGWYRTIKPRSSAGAYQASQTDQMYKSGSSWGTPVTSAVNATHGYGMANSNNKIFYPSYAQGTSGSAGTKASGILRQYGSQYLASNLGYNYKQILNYYYSGSGYSSGDVVIFRY